MPDARYCLNFLKDNLFAGLSSAGGRAGDISGYQSDGDLVRQARLGGAQGCVSEGAYNDVSGYTSDNHYDR